MYKNIKIIVNPVSGKDEAILSFIAEAFKDSEIHWDVLVTKKEGDAKEFAEGLIHSGADLICVYGGDGTVCQVAQALAHQDIPMFVLPGGTANVVAKELPTHLNEKYVPEHTALQARVSGYAKSIADTRFELNQFLSKAL